MHRTEGEDHKIESGKRRFASANPPLQKATRLPAEFMNAVQEEICSVIEEAVPQIPLHSTSAEDRSAGWKQLLKALQEGHIIKGTSFHSTALSSGLTEDSGFVSTPNTRESVQDLRATMPYGFDKILDRYRDPNPTSKKSKEIPLSVLAQLFGADQFIIIDTPMTDPIDLVLGGTSAEAWDGNLTILITGGCTNTSLSIVAPTPRKSRVTLLNAGWGTQADSVSSYGEITWNGAGLQTFKFRKDYRADMYFNNSGTLVDIRQTPPHAAAYNGSPAMWSRLHGIRDMKTVDVETPFVTPASGNSTYPFPLLVLDQSSSVNGGTNGAGVRVAGDVGIELPQSSISRINNSRKRKTGRIFHSSEGELIWDKGLDASGTQRGYTRLDDSVEDILRHYRTVDGIFAADGSSLGFFSHVGDKDHFNLSPFMNSCLLNKAMILFSQLQIPDDESITVRLVLRTRACDGTTGYLDYESTDVVLPAGSDTYRSVEFTFPSPLVFVAGSAIEPMLKSISRVGVGTKSVGGISTAISFTRVSGAAI